MHILQRHAKRTTITRPTTPLDASYDVAAGVWRNMSGPVALDPANQLASKKNDLETGEDQKGE